MFRRKHASLSMLYLTVAVPASVHQDSNSFMSKQLPDADHHHLQGVWSSSGQLLHKGVRLRQGGMGWPPVQAMNHPLAHDDPNVLLSIMRSMPGSS
jgi:hypothetical protein